MRVAVLEQRREDELPEGAQGGDHPTDDGHRLTGSPRGPPRRRSAPKRAFARGRWTPARTDPRRIGVDPGLAQGRQPLATPPCVRSSLMSASAFACQSRVARMNGRGRPRARPRRCRTLEVRAVVLHPLLRVQACRSGSGCRSRSASLLAAQLRHLGFLLLARVLVEPSCAAPSWPTSGSCAATARSGTAPRCRWGCG